MKKEEMTDIYNYQQDVMFINILFIPIAVTGGKMSDVDVESVREASPESYADKRFLRMVITTEMLDDEGSESIEFVSKEVKCTTLTHPKREISSDPHDVGGEMFGRPETIDENDQSDDLHFHCRNYLPPIRNIDLHVRSLADEIDIIFGSGSGTESRTRKYCLIDEKVRK
jgi:hypothetical protein